MKRNSSNICPVCDAGDPSSVVTECECEASRPVRAPAVASKGDLIVVRQQRTYNNLLMGAYAGYVRFVPAIVTSASCAGTVTKYHTKTSNPVKLQSGDTVLVCGAKVLQGVSPLALRDALEASYDDMASVKTAILAGVQSLLSPVHA